MQIPVVIPMHGYPQGVKLLVEWARAGSPERPILVVDDGSSAADRTAVESLGLGMLLDVPPGQGGGPRFALLEAARLFHTSPWVLVTESDAVPNDETFDAMVRLAESSTDSDLASVSPVYEHPDTKADCYPTNPNWFKLGHGNCLEITERPGFGRIACADAVPFLFSLWRPCCLAQIESSMPVLMRLDTALGGKLTGRGFRHLRLLDHRIGHAGGGRQSQLRRPISSR